MTPPDIREACRCGHPRIDHVSGTEYCRLGCYTSEAQRDFCINSLAWKDRPICERFTPVEADTGHSLKVGAIEPLPYMILVPLREDASIRFHERIMHATTPDGEEVQVSSSVSGAHLLFRIGGRRYSIGVESIAQAVCELDRSLNGGADGRE